jgi:hypothetical protein
LLDSASKSINTFTYYANTLYFEKPPYLYTLEPSVPYKEVGDTFVPYMEASGVEKVSDHGTIGPRKFFEFPENISPRKKNIIVKI